MKNRSHSISFLEFILDLFKEILLTKPRVNPKHLIRRVLQKISETQPFLEPLMLILLILLTSLH